MATLTPRLASSPDGSSSGWLGEWMPWVVLAGAVAILGPAEAVATRHDGAWGFYLAVTLLLAASVGLGRRWPGLALGLVWLLGAFHVATGTRPLVTELAIVVVAFTTARWGGLATVWLGGLSIPVAAVIGVFLVGSRLVGGLGYEPSSVTSADPGLTLDSPETWAVAAGLAILGIPWTAGLAMRSWDRARASRVSLGRAEEDVVRARHESEQSLEIARLREEQARFAHDVHDVVGHSLAVILAQAESAQYLRDDDPAALKSTMAIIADSARSSLQDVRHVLSATPQAQRTAPPSAGLDRLVEGVRSSGREIVDSQVGVPRPLPPELAGVAYRVLQEMLTNAVRHGRPDRPVHVERHWPDGSWEGDLRIEVRNAEESTEGNDRTEHRGHGGHGGQGGQGIDGMRSRLESVGGRLDVRRRGEAPNPTFTVTAWVPVRSSIA